MDSIQAPTPFACNNDNKNNIIDQNVLKKVNNFRLIYVKNQNEKIEFNITTGLFNNNIYIFAKENKEFELNEFLIELSLDYLILKNKQFKSYDSIEEAFNLIIKLFQKEKIIIGNYSEKELLLEIKLSNLSGEEESFRIILQQRNINKDIIIQELIDKVIFLENEIKNLKVDNNLEKEILLLKKEKEKQDKEIEDLKQLILMNNKNVIIKNHFDREKLKIKYKIDSKIIKDNSLDFVIDKIKQTYQKNNTPELKLLYRGSENNFEPGPFHSKCDKIKGTITLVKNNKGFIFGGFTTESWEGNNILKKDDKAFCFSINHKKIYEVIKEKEAIKCNKNYGPVFLNDIFGFRKYNLKDGECYIIKACYYKGCDKDFEINGGEKELKAVETEIFQILF